MDMKLSKFWEIVKDRQAWSAPYDRITKSWTWFGDWITAKQNKQEEDYLTQASLVKLQGELNSLIELNKELINSMDLKPTEEENIYLQFVAAVYQHITWCPGRSPVRGITEFSKRLHSRGFGISVYFS